MNTRYATFLAAFLVISTACLFVFWRYTQNIQTGRYMRVDSSESSQFLILDTQTGTLYGRTSNGWNEGHIQTGVMITHEEK